VLTLGFFRHQASARRGRVVSRDLATAANFLTAASLALEPLPSTASRSHSMPGVSRREPAGTPSLYLPVSRPEASGDQMVVPRPRVLKSGAYSFSTRARWKRLYCGCSMVGACRP